MRYQLTIDLLHHLDSNGSLEIGNADEKTTAILENLAIPIDLKRLLQWDWTTSGGQLGPYVLCSVNKIPATHDYDQLLKFKMIPIGDTANGDILVIRIVDEDCAVGLISHDEFWEGESDPVQAYAEVTPSIDEYLWRVAESKYLPIDFYAAIELVELRRSRAERWPVES
jgi:hypothetical protein